MADRYKTRGKPVPAEFIGPALLPGYEGWFAAFYELSTDRQLGMAIGPIPAGSIERQNEAPLFRRVIRAMDGVYLAHVRGVPDVPESDNPARDAFRAKMRGKT